ncbi:unnamed protein product [Choristocarpus tenellus]
MNLKEHVLEELELHEYYVRDALQCLLHTVLFIRAPGALRPREVGDECNFFRLRNERVHLSHLYQPYGVARCFDSILCVPTIASSYSPRNATLHTPTQVDGAMEGFWQSLSPAGPDLAKGWITISFFMRRVKKSIFGLMLKEEKVVWEQWVIPVLVNTAMRPLEDDQASGQNSLVQSLVFKGKFNGCEQL